MAMKARSLNVDRWQCSRPEWNYSPALQFWWRIGQVAWFDAMKTRKDGSPTDEALLARNWFARSEPEKNANGERESFSFEEVCDWLSLNLEAERVAVLAAIDACADFDTEECDARLEALLNGQPAPRFDLPDDYRFVPERDQMSMFAAA